MVSVRVHGIALAPPDETPVMLLQEESGEQRWLPIWIGTPEANALLAAQQRIEMPRPDTITLIAQVIDTFSRRVERVEVTEIRDGVFLSDLVLDDGVRISARPSDAVAIGLRAGAPVEVAESVLEMASADINVADSQDEPDVEHEVDEFRAQLDDVNPDDFQEPPRE